MINNPITRITSTKIVLNNLVFGIVQSHFFSKLTQLKVIKVQKRGVKNSECNVFGRSTAIHKPGSTTTVRNFQ